MNFTSLLYLFFLGSGLIVYYLIPVKYRFYFLLFLSVFFYAYVQVSFLFFILILVLLNMIFGIGIEKSINQRVKKYWFYAGMIINIGILFYYKYFTFLIHTILHLGEKNDSSFFYQLTIPIGISYFTFQIIGYLIEIFRGGQIAEKQFSKLLFFTIFFPKLMVGPIERPKHFFPQISIYKYLDSQNIINGLQRIAWGLFKKLVVADRISLYVSVVDSNPQQQSGLTILLASLLYTIQVYADFSGYADIAIGSARLFGYELLENFNRPFFAKSITEFWRRWHISLSTWVNDYIFNPILLKNRRAGLFGLFYALLISFVVIGIWHGPTWNYILFGIMQAVIIFIETITKNISKNISKYFPPTAYNIFRILSTYLIVSFSLIIFRFPTLGDSFTLLSLIFNSFGHIYIDRLSTILFIFIGTLIVLLFDFYHEYQHNLRLPALKELPWYTQHISFVLLLLYMLVAAVFDGGQFIYFNF